MPRSQQAQLYRGILREFRRAATQPGQINRRLISKFRALAAQSQSDSAIQDLQNSVLFLKSQREYTTLLERYNPLIDLTAEERIEATARRVGLNMPKTPATDDR
ncbi:hypothetical protein E1B28_004418 [Marasmius oreades]|uniref:Complex 1 LYR protein n=1 Tax=Marasmius oreades TaxID=181124 RepID=A0A9P7UYM6_9AGAR|nr:uncharacterized protein E1B28_004418 [Marasmius oreades]KAG7097025.1 hypothetical protein E1B28_004418 [Marasmius oreades]